MRIVTWNINSLRLRLPLLAELDRQLRPDVICLQETKVPDELFPSEALTELGYAHQVRRGMKSYNGVAILARHPLSPVPDAPDWCERGDCRHAAASIAGEHGPVEIHNFYVPAGGDIPDIEENPKFAHKLAFVDQVTEWFQTHHRKRTVIVGDLNIAPLEHDVWSHKQLLKIVSHTPPETTRLNAWLDTGFVDAMRHFVPPTEKLYTWWSYRNRDWSASNRGRRLDHIWVTPDLKDVLHGMQVIREARNWTSPSDHVPVMLDMGA
ncbi:exodeoxyribonuclease III [Acetobacter aceti NRIC 0242]|uniref:Exodeoxyribonuclease III n=1 Tax=Acetobacter aceti NBRC 14818 TaxID=887700 RepID=A0AB33II68_ACEAC|nr:exodeoxyribonuclease III [Acetobacter aceti]TCS33206.1 exodeoxyribonuclease-3 [Acetobacter aceti NBRC 14818]BCK75732.1 exodeoxyribonuclease III [Acetobacter aceti NBRC 14818]GAN57911.1 exodeoxyribonuclease III [Acetobacter aceti NBRC 14818]GBO81089.1 exodeoxyribonuclease III [Acetobacter aceti NRIC 0242]